MQRNGTYDGPTMGGYVLCAKCEATYDARPKAVQQAERDWNDIGRTGIPREFQASTWQQWETRDGCEVGANVARVWWNANDLRDLFLTGPVGTGKTLVACILAVLTFHKRSKDVRFLTATDLMDKLRASEFAPHESDHPYALAHLASHALLVIDDVGAEKPSEYTVSRLLSVLEQRHNAGKPTILTSNLDYDALAERMGDQRIASRLSDWADLVVLRGKDYRHERASKRRR